MTGPYRSPIASCAEQFLQQALRFWPAESQEWGRALAAEAAQIDSPLEAIRWALGGLAFFLRSLGAHFLVWSKLPAGANAPASLSGSEPPLLPKRSRLTTALLMFSAVVLLLLPWGRQAVASVTDWLSFGYPNARQIDALAAQAEKEKDAHLLAFSAITHPDSSRGKQLASAAVSLDPSLTWIYTGSFEPPADKEFPAPWLSALHSYDPQNGFASLLAANRRAQAAFNTLTSSHTPLPGEFDQLLERDTRWQQLMREAVLAPKCDSYRSRRHPFAREVWASHPSLSPALVLHSLWRERLPDIFFLRSYARLQIVAAQQAASRGDSLGAERSLNELRAFGERLAAPQQTDIEQFGGVEVSRESLLALRSLYVLGNRADEIRSTDQALAELQKLRDALFHSDRRAYLGFVGLYQRSALGVQLSALLLLLGVFALTASLIFLEVSAFLPRVLNRLSARIACTLADYAPPFLPVMALGLLLSFRPFAAAISQFRSGTGLFADDRYFARAYFELSWLFSSLSGRLFDPLLLWWAATIVLSATAILISIRAVIRSGPA